MKETILRSSRGPNIERASQRLRIPSSLYLFADMFSLLDEESDKIYLTDGGHIENLGLYELLKRRCRLIVVVDAEADPTLSFSSFVTLQRYARVDLGIRIDDMPWSAIRARSREYDRDVSAANASGAAPCASAGCHATVGRINYPDAPAGILLYIKSSMTGDENDLILNYKRDNPRFPHETTGDQFFGEAQFEAYRALGFHAMMRVLTGEDRIPGLIKSEPDCSLLPGQSEADAQAQRHGVINEIFKNHSATAELLPR